MVRVAWLSQGAGPRSANRHPSVSNDRECGPARGLDANIVQRLPIPKGAHGSEHGPQSTFVLQFSHFWRRVLRPRKSRTSSAPASQTVDQSLRTAAAPQQTEARRRPQGHSSIRAFRRVKLPRSPASNMNTCPWPRPSPAAHEATTKLKRGSGRPRCRPWKPLGSSRAP